MTDLAETFPELTAIESPDLRDGTRRAWETSMAETDVADLESVPWFPPAQRELDLPDERLVPHVRDVCALATALADALDERRWTVDRDVVLAGALVHDVSKLYEFDGQESTSVHDLLDHPHYGLHVTARAGLPVEVQHVLLAHTPRTAVEPRTVEAEVVRRADEVAASAIRARADD